ncbi:G patch domain-containing protein 4 [Thalassophryne amazonica]|uniref:G patch domain-containing protein 4 n=1 Tax=Thalassophryne amazonica TaxID=390379 RepID=UPI0014720B2D|nr:G patch domain-containing protein 4 [Thalassophryne amazonica]XP_034030114.1 G patch domain-containing protein 4 [Thalassophryne amazonica]
MADTMQEETSGIKFAEQQLRRHGWKHGKGLGRDENGMTEAIKVKVKCNKGGIGHKEGEQFTFQWWDHVFNKASSSLKVESDQNSIKVKKMTGEDEGMVSNKKPRKMMLAKSKLYGCFVKSATLLSGQEQPEPKSCDSDDSSSSDEERLDLSSTTKLSDADLKKACGGRTAHKGARHGLTMSAKLARLEQQEAAFMAKYGKKCQPASASSVRVPQTQQSSSGDSEEASQSKKIKRKPSFDEVNGDAMSESSEGGVKPKKRKKKKKTREGSEEMVVAEEELTNADKNEEQSTKRKCRKKKNSENGERETAATECKSPEKTAQVSSDLHTTEEKMKKSKRHSKSVAASAEVEDNDTESSQKKKKKKGKQKQ